MQSASYIKKERGNGIPYTFASHDSVTNKLRSPMIEAGIVCTQDVVDFTTSGNLTTAKVRVDFINVDDPADRVSIHSFGYGIDKQDKGPGKAMSYAFKYALLKCFMLETGDDPERDQIERAPAAIKPEPINVPAAEIYTGTRPQKEMLRARMESRGIKDVDVMKEISGQLIADPSLDVDKLIALGLTEQANKKK